MLLEIERLYRNKISKDVLSIAYLTNDKYLLFEEANQRNLISNRRSFTTSEREIEIERWDIQVFHTGQSGTSYPKRLT